MNPAEAYKVLLSINDLTFDSDGTVSRELLGPVMVFNPDTSEQIGLQGCYSADQLEAMAIWMRGQLAPQGLEE